ncbi:MAG: hypothetical protein WCO86_04790, partial [Planctomycetota bacterium]
MTILAVARDNRWLTGIAAPEHCRSTIQPQMAFLRVRSVAVEAFRGEKWFDLSLKADVINGIDLEVRAGEFLSIVGTSGSG